MRDAGVVRQLFDYSCGSAALATLLSTPSSPVSEQEILFETLDGLTDEQKSETMELGLSLLDLRQAAERRGLHAAGYRVTPDFLQKLTRPVLVYIEPHGYRHFAVFRGLRGDRSDTTQCAATECAAIQGTATQSAATGGDRSGRRACAVAGANTHGAATKSRTDGADQAGTDADERADPGGRA